MRSPPDSCHGGAGWFPVPEMSRLSRYGNGPLVSAVVRHIERPPNLVRVAVLIFAFVVAALGLHDSRNPENTPSETLSFVHSVLATEEQAGPALSESADSGGQSVHCPYHCLRAPLVRPRAGYLWYAALSIAGLLLGGVCCRVYFARPRRARRTFAGTAGAELLLRLCVCRR